MCFIKARKWALFFFFNREAQIVTLPIRDWLLLSEKLTTFTIQKSSGLNSWWDRRSFRCANETHSKLLPWPFWLWERHLVDLVCWRCISLAAIPPASEWALALGEQWLVTFSAGPATRQMFSRNSIVLSLQPPSCFSSPPTFLLSL